MHTPTKRSRRPSSLRIALGVAAAALVSMSIFGVPDTAEAMPFGAKTDFPTGVNPESVLSTYRYPGLEMGQLPMVRSFGVQVTLTP